MGSDKEIQGTFRYEQDSKRFHRFKIKAEAGMTGSIYISKKRETLPDVIILKRVVNSDP